MRRAQNDIFIGIFEYEDTLYSIAVSNRRSAIYKVNHFSVQLSLQYTVMSLQHRKLLDFHYLCLTSGFHFYIVHPIPQRQVHPVHYVAKYMTR